jgi:hypothetical protein
MAWYDRNWVSEALDRKSERDRNIAERRAQTWSQIGGIADDVQARIWEQEDRRWEREDRAMDRRSRDANTRYMMKLGDLYEKQLAEEEQKLALDNVYNQTLLKYRMGGVDDEGNQVERSTPQAWQMMIDDPNTSEEMRSRIFREQKEFADFTRTKLSNEVASELRTRDELGRVMLSVANSKSPGEKLINGDLKTINGLLAELGEPPLPNDGKGEDGQIDLNLLENTLLRNGNAQDRQAAYAIELTGLDRAPKDAGEIRRTVAQIASRLAVSVNSEADFIEKREEIEAMYGPQWANYFGDYDDTFKAEMEALANFALSGAGERGRPNWSERDLFMMVELGLDPRATTQDQFDDAIVDSMRDPSGSWQDMNRRYSDRSQDLPSGGAFNEGGFRSQQQADATRILGLENDTVADLSLRQGASTVSPVVGVAIIVPDELAERLERAGEPIDDRRGPGRKTWTPSPGFAGKNIPLHSPREIGAEAIEAQEARLRAFDVGIERSDLSGLYADIDDFVRETYITRTIPNLRSDSPGISYDQAVADAGREYDELDVGDRATQISQEMLGWHQGPSLIDYILNPNRLAEEDLGIEFGDDLMLLSRAGRDPDRIRAVLREIRDARSRSDGSLLLGLRPSEYRTGIGRPGSN